MFGKILVYLSLIVSVSSALFYFLSVKNKKFLKPGRYSYVFLTLIFVAISIYLLANILSHNFQFTYIWEYSSSQLHDWFLIASFYSGQQGSFLLWGLFIVIIGLFLIPSAKKHGYESIAMGLYSSILIFVVLMLIFKSPFDYVWDTFASEGLEKGFTPQDGRGLNPVLQNYWITIHPPILFIGYSLMSVPYVFALVGLIKKDYHRWIKIALPWTLVASAFLGLGIMLGGFWAYETLGWGGWWGWDPVENSSLLPWLASVALIHTMLVQNKTKGLVKTNFILAMGTFVLVLYATYLTRSGILGDTSVHSFITPGKIVYFLLQLFMGVFAVVSILLVAIRFKDLQRHIGKTQFNYTSKEFSLSIGSILILASTIIIFIGTSWPWMAPYFGQPKAAIDIQLYNQWNLPIAILILVINAVSLYQRWYSKNFKDLLKLIAFPLIISVISTIVFFVMGYNDIGYAILFFSAVFSLIANAEFLVKNIIKYPRKTGAYLSHLGLSLLIFGVIASGGYDYSKDIQLITGESKEVFGYTLTFKDVERIEKEKTDRQKFKYNIEVSSPNLKASIVSPILYWSNFNNWESPFLEPGIRTKLTKDIYVSPKAVETISTAPELNLIRGYSGIVPLDTSVTVSLELYEMNDAPDGNAQEVMMGTVVNYKKNGEVITDTLNTILDVSTWEGNPMWKRIPGTDVEIGMKKLLRNMEDVAMTQANFIFRFAGQPEPEPKRLLTVEVSVKPFINLVWAGTIAIVLGFIIAVFKYTQNKNITEE